ncbi:MAG: hypothetical protein JRN20_03835 [Nitrososphaerota archaeon]|nr:hypothetical protein [Nitrososphaerota archaeon]
MNDANLEQPRFRRSRLETIYDILAAIAAGTDKPTHIMYKANLSWRILQQYFRSLESQGVIALTNDQGRRAYTLTEKGFNLLAQFKVVRESLLLQNV